MQHVMDGHGMHWLRVDCCGMDYCGMEREILMGLTFLLNCYYMHIKYCLNFIFYVTNIIFIDLADYVSFYLHNYFRVI